MEPHEISPTSAANFRMIDIGDKAITQRRAVASGSLVASRETVTRIRERTLPKGDALILAEVAGIQGAKKTSDILPLCHPLSMTSVRVWSEPGEDRIRVFCEAKTNGATGVEMEALCGVTAALLCIYDLTKGIDPVLEIQEIRLDLKEGGKSGRWVSPAVTPSANSKAATLSFQKVKAAVITLSDRCSQKTQTDISGPAAVTWLEKRGANVSSILVLPDHPDELFCALKTLLTQDAPSLIVTSGGTGLSDRDITPETVRKLALEYAGREVVGIGELLRQTGSKHTPTAWLSRSLAVLVNKTLILCLPGKPAAVTEGLDGVEKLLLHALHTASGGGHG